MRAVVKVRVFYPALQQAIGGANEVDVEGDTVGQCLDDLVKRYPDAKTLLLDVHGALLKRVYVFVNAESMHKAEFVRTVTDKDELLVAVLATGG
jgi:molybdopterin converting factor small subunit